MDKIIDGVDVSECEHYRAEIETKMPYGEYEIQKDKCHYLGIEIIQNCKGNKDCIYKQLKRKEQENEELKQDLHEVENACCCFESENADLRKENERLKEEIERLKSIVESNNQQVEQAELLVMDNDRLQQEVENLKDTIYYDVEKYRQALQEIREIASEPCIVDENCQTCNSGCMQNNILDKINEVIGAEQIG